MCIKGPPVMAGPFHLLIYFEKKKVLTIYIYYLEGAMMNPVRETKLTQTQTLTSRGIYSSRALDRQNNCNANEKIFSIWNSYGYNPLNIG